MTTDEAVKKLTAIGETYIGPPIDDGDDDGKAHSDADGVLLEWAKANGGNEVAEAYVRLSAKYEVCFWYA